MISFQLKLSIQLCYYIIIMQIICKATVAQIKLLMMNTNQYELVNIDRIAINLHLLNIN